MFRPPTQYTIKSMTKCKYFESFAKNLLNWTRVVEQFRWRLLNQKNSSLVTVILFCIRKFFNSCTLIYVLYQFCLIHLPVLLSNYYAVLPNITLKLGSRSKFTFWCMVWTQIWEDWYKHFISWENVSSICRITASFIGINEVRAVLLILPVNLTVHYERSWQSAYPVR